MTIPPFAHALIRKSERALESARIDLRHGDADGAVNRAYYAMFNAARAALLSAGIPEGDLPRTHNGVIAAFGQQAVKTGRVDPGLGRSFNEAEVLRLRADYTGLEIAPKTAQEIVSRAELFVRTVEREFGLEIAANELTAEKAGPSERRRDREAGATHREESTDLVSSRPSAEETRRKAREDWLKNYYHKNDDAHQLESQGDAREKDEQRGAGKAQPEKDTGPEIDPE